MEEGDELPAVEVVPVMGSVDDPDVRCGCWACLLTHVPLGDVMTRTRAVWFVTTALGNMATAATPAVKLAYKYVLEAQELDVGTASEPGGPVGGGPPDADALPVGALTVRWGQVFVTRRKGVWLRAGPLLAAVGQAMWHLHNVVVLFRVMKALVEAMILWAGMHDATHTGAGDVKAHKALIHKNLVLLQAEVATVRALASRLHVELDPSLAREDHVVGVLVTLGLVAAWDEGSGVMHALRGCAQDATTMTAMAGAEVPEVAPPQQLDSCCACCVKHWQERVQRVLGYTIGTVERVQVTNSVFAAWEAACTETFFPRVNQKAMVTFCGQKAVRMTQLTQHLIMTCVSLTHGPA
jgi:hypothetical protein